MIDRKRTACFTGHRKIPVQEIKGIEKQLDKIIENVPKRRYILWRRRFIWV